MILNIITAMAAVLAIAILCLVIYLIAGRNNSLTVREYVFERGDNKEEITFVHLGDLHGTCYGENNEELLRLIEKQKPDAILMTGDMLDEEVDINIDLSFIKRISALYPVYAVTGNHEEEAEEHSFEELKRTYRKQDITLLCDENTAFECKGRRINICGVDIPKNNGDPTQEAIKRSMSGIDTSNYTIMLFHRPDPCKSFEGRGIDLLLCGHTHGGQWIVPGLINGVYAPEQGLFPKYAGGHYDLKGGMKMVVTRGLSLRSTFIPRAFDPPEVVVIKIR